MGMDFFDHLLADRRAKMITEAMDNSEYWKAQYQEMLDKYNKLARKYDYDTSQREAERDYLIEVLRDNVDNLNISKDKINENLAIARSKAAEVYPPA